MLQHHTSFLKAGGGFLVPALAVLLASTTPALAEEAWWVASRSAPESPCGIYFKYSAIGSGRYQATNRPSAACNRLRYGNVYSWRRRGNWIALYTRSGRLIRRFNRERGEIYVSGRLVLRRADTPWPYGRRRAAPTYARRGDFTTWWINYRSRPARPCGIQFKNNVVASGRYQATKRPGRMCRRMGYGRIYSWERRRGGITLYDGKGRTMHHFVRYGRNTYVSGKLVLRRADTPWPFARRGTTPDYARPAPKYTRPAPDYARPMPGRAWPGDFTTWWVVSKYRPNRPCRIAFSGNLLADGRNQATNYPGRMCFRLRYGKIASWQRRRRGIVLYGQGGVRLGRFVAIGGGVYESGNLILRKASVERTGVRPMPGRAWPGDLTTWWVVSKSRPNRPCRIAFSGNMLARGRYQAINYPGRMCVRLGYGNIYAWQRRRRGIVLYSRSGIRLGRFFATGRGQYQSRNLILRKASTERTGLRPPPSPGRPVAGVCDPTFYGKYSRLLRRIYAPQDRRRYGKCRDFGPWSGTSWAGKINLPRGYWSYKYPHWYLWARRGR